MRQVMYTRPSVAKYDKQNLELLDSVVASAGKQVTTNSGGKRATSNKREKLSRVSQATMSFGLIRRKKVNANSKQRVTVCFWFS